MHILIKSGENMIAMVVLHVKWNYTYPNQKWQEQVSNYCAAYEMEIHTL